MADNIYMTAIIAKRSEDELASWLATEPGFITGLCSWDHEPIALESYQLAFLESRCRFRWIAKSRQVGYSFVFALEALARCHLRDGHTAIFVSYNLEDAKEKIMIAKQVFDELPLAYQKRLVVDSRTELAFESNGRSKRISRIISVPSKAPRGKKGDVYLDELAHYLDDREVYKGSTALILRSNGQLTGCSTPLGRRGIFWEIAEQELRPYPHHWRQRVPWWLCRSFSIDVRRAAAEAPRMSTEERVRAFGTPGLQDQFDALAIEDFQQEFELDFCDESTSFFPFELLLPCTTDALETYTDYQAFPASFKGRLTAGFDVGRHRDLSELVIVEEVGGVHHLRLWRSYDKVPFAEQEADLDRMLRTLPIARLSIDQGGIGMHLAENLSRRHGPVVSPETFTNASKEIWCNDFKILMQRRAVVLPRDRELVAQIHSIRKSLTPSGKVSFEAPRSARGGHADRFWALVLAVQRERGPAPVRPTTIGVRVIG